MYKYYNLNQQDAENLLQLEIENLRYAISLYDRVIEVVKRFDGKAANKRLNTALKAVDGNLRANINFYYPSVGIYYSTYNNRSCRSTVSCCTNYIDTESINLIFGVCNGVNADGRFDANVIVNSLLKSRKMNEEKLHEIEDGVERVAEWKEKIAELKEQVKLLDRSIPHVFKEYYPELREFNNVF